VPFIHLWNHFAGINCVIIRIQETLETDFYTQSFLYQHLECFGSGREVQSRDNEWVWVAGEKDPRHSTRRWQNRVPVVRIYNPSTQEADFRRIAALSQLGQIVLVTLSQKYPTKKGLVQYLKC
jgi:hypothetical protein